MAKPESGTVVVVAGAHSMDDRVVLQLHQVSFRRGVPRNLGSGSHGPMYVVEQMKPQDLVEGGSACAARSQDASCQYH
jgi:hypothetical protein